MRDVGDRWCILRTSGGRTLPLARSLQAAGIEAWTPSRTFLRRVPGKANTKKEATVAILPTFVFARAVHVGDLAAIAVDPASNHPAFSVFRFAGRVPMLGAHDVGGLQAAHAEADAAYRTELDAEDREARRRARAETLRTEKARRRALRSERRVFAEGSAVQVADAPSLSGLTGVVKRGDGRSYFVAFGGALNIEIEAWQLIPADVDRSAKSAA